jgi:hypothetical protein
VNQAPSADDTTSPDNPPEEPERLPDDIDDDTLRKYFTLTKSDLAEVDQCRGAVNKIGFAVQLCTLRWRGYFLADTRGVHAKVVEIISSQLGLLPLPVDSYPQNEKTRWDHLERIRHHLGFVRCDAPQRERLLNYLTASAQALTRTTALREAAHRWLKQEQIVRPGRTTLRDLIVSAREDSLQNVYTLLCKDLSPRQTTEIDALLIVPAAGPESDALQEESAPHSRLESFKAVARKESPQSLLGLLDQLSDIPSLGLTAWPALADIHPATRRLLAGWGYRYSVWNLRRFSAAKRNGIVICFMHAARAEMTDGIVEMQDKLITSIHNKARKRYEELLRATEEARTRAVEVLEGIGSLVLDNSIEDSSLRERIFALLPSDDISRLVEGCRNLRASADGSPLALVNHWYSYTRKYSPALLEKTPFQFAEDSALGRAVVFLKDLNAGGKGKSFAGAPFDFLPRRWLKHVVLDSAKSGSVLSRPHYEPALLTTLNERLKSGDVTVSHSRRWTDFEEYLIPRSLWAAKRADYYTHLELPLDAEAYLIKLNDHLKRVTENVDKRVPQNKALTIDAPKGEFHLAALKAVDKPDSIKILKDLIESKLNRSDLADVVIDVDNQTNFLHHFLPTGCDTATHRRDAIAALLAIGCNLAASAWRSLRFKAQRNQSCCRLVSHGGDPQVGQHRHHKLRLPHSHKPRLWPRRYLFGGRNAVLCAHSYPGG